MFHGEENHANVPALPESGNAEIANLDWVAEYPVIKEQAIVTAQLMGVEAVQDLIVSHARFDTLRSHVQDADGNSQVRHHYALELLLSVMPECLTNAQAAGISSGQAYELVRTIVTAEDRSIYSFIDKPVVQLSRAFKMHVDRELPMEEGDYATLHSLVADTASKEDDNLAVIDAYRALTRIGFTAEQSDGLIRNELFTDSLVINYALRTINALSVAQVDPSLLKEVCRLIPGEKPFLPSIQASYAMLHDLITYVYPGRDMTPNDLLTTTRDLLVAGGTMADVADHFTTGGRQQITGGAVAYHPAERRDKHFTPTTGPLELSPLPYRTERPFTAGAADIGRLATNDINHRQPFGEGMWVFDNGSQTPIWYSLGGETDIDYERRAVIATYPAYPLSELSNKPVLYHAHPTALEWVVTPDRDTPELPNAAVPIIGRFMAATPSRRDYAMVAELMRSPGYSGEPIRSFIAHGSGTTEYVYPNDPDALDEMALTSKALRDDTLAATDWNNILFARKWKGLLRGDRKHPDQVVSELVERFSGSMPKGFELRMLGVDEPVEL